MGRGEGKKRNGRESRPLPGYAAKMRECASTSSNRGYKAPERIRAKV
jgi:hypothetical protein